MIWILFVIIVILQVLDTISTIKALMIPGTYEANKLMLWLMNKLGILPALILTKLTLCLSLAAAVLFAPSIYLTVALGVITIGYLVVIVNNFRRT